MERRAFLGSLAVLAVAGGATAQQPGKAYRVGALHVLPPEASLGFGVLRGELRRLGYVEGETVALDYRWAASRESMAAAVAELIARKSDVIVTTSEQTALAARDATRDVPIVMASSGDPVAAGLVISLARPGGNITGLTSQSSELTSKRLELLKEAVPNVARIAVLSAPGIVMGSKAAEQMAKKLSVELQRIEVRGPKALEHAFETAVKARAGAVLVLSGPVLFQMRQAIAELGLKHQLPTAAAEEGFAKAGGLMQYGASVVDNFRRAAHYVDKILKGAKPADLPVEQPTKFELVINLKTAKALGLKVPPSLLQRADQVIE
jgi:ABC-type uncharacterized transport system substrate-binding protein